MKNEVKKDSVINRLKENKTRTVMIFIILLIVQLLLLSLVKDLNNKITIFSGRANDMQIKIETDLIKNTVRPQERRQLMAIREGWIMYLQTHPETELLLQKDGKVVYGNNNGQELCYDESTMYKKKRQDNYFDIYLFSSNKLIIEKAYPQWNKEQLKNIFSIIAIPVKSFGPTGDILIFDAYSGEVLVNNSYDSANVPQVLAENGKRYIQLDYKHPNNKNPKACKEIIEKYLWRADSDENTELTYFFNESQYMGKDANNFSKYPLGNYNREFQEKIVLPYESIGINSQQMQLTIVLGAQESEVMASYKESIDSNKEICKTLNEAYKSEFTILVVSIVISLFIVLLSIYSLTVNTHICIKKSDCNTHHST